MYCVLYCVFVPVFLQIPLSSKSKIHKQEGGLTPISTILKPPGTNLQLIKIIYIKSLQPRRLQPEELWGVPPNKDKTFIGVGVELSSNEA